MIDILSMDQQDMEILAVHNGFPKFRGKQLYEWCHKKEVFDFEKMTNLPKDFGSFLRENAVIHRGKEVTVRSSKDKSTIKFLLDYGDTYIETVLMRYAPKSNRSRNTLCVSTQAGCAMKCKFCATGKNGFSRNLTTGEIVDQVNFANAYLRKNGEDHVSNLVYMGMGEPLLNYDAVLKSVRILNEAKAIGMRRITISTCGLVPEIRRLGEENLQLTLAISLHGTDDPLRNELMPINKRWNIEALFGAVDDYIKATNRRVTIEYALFDHVNDSQEQAAALADLVQKRLCHVNLVPGNPVQGTKLLSSSVKRQRAFYDILSERHIEVSIRESMGKDIDGACGQLKGKYLQQI